jgi:hypothetical protein
VAVACPDVDWNEFVNTRKHGGCLNTQSWCFGFHTFLNTGHFEGFIRPEFSVSRNICTVRWLIITFSLHVILDVLAKTQRN